MKSTLEGFGHDFSAWDKWLEDQGYGRPDDVKYNNWCPFKSPKGRMMAFYNTSYGDIRIVDLESKSWLTGDPKEIVTDFYSKKNPKVYGHHTNVSTYVPSYFGYPYQTTRSVIERYEEQVMNGHSWRKPIFKLDENGKNVQEPWTMFVAREDFDLENEENEDINLDNLRSLPIAFNAWTIWACDYEFYVDAIDLRQVDDGIIKLWKEPGIVIPIEAGHIRNYVKCSIDLDDSVDKVSVDFKFLVERHQDRMHIEPNGDLDFSDIFKNEWDKVQKKMIGPFYETNDELPWQTLQKRLNKP